MLRLVGIVASVCGTLLAGNSDVQQPDLDRVLARIAGQPSRANRLILGGEAYAALLDSRGLVLLSLIWGAGL